MLLNIWNKKTAIIIYGCFILILLICLKCKTNYHVDEILSYGLANNDGWFVITTDTRVVPAGAIISEYMDADGDINLHNVWKNQAKDVHPPLYYLLLHLICSAFPNSVSMRYAGGINIAFALLSLLFMRKIAALFIDRKAIIDLLSIAFISSAGILSGMTFLRMYVMAMALVTILAYYFLNKSESNLSLYDWLLIFGVSVAGALTHYYCTVYIIFLSITMFVYYLYRRRFRNLIYLCLTMGCAAGLSYFIFPDMIKHVMESNRGEESITNLKNIEDYPERLRVFMGIIDEELFGKLLVYAICIVVVFLIWSIINDGLLMTMHNLKEVLLHDNRITSEKTIKYVVLFIPVTAYYFCVSKIAVYETNRYLYPVYVLVFVGIFCLLFNVLELLYKYRQAAFALCICIALVTCGSWKYTQWVYLGNDSKSALMEAERYGRFEGLCIYDESWKVLPSYVEISKFSSMIFVQEKDFENLNKWDWEYEDGFVLFLIGDNTAECLEQINKNLPEGLTSRVLLRSAYGTSYLFEKTQKTSGIQIK